MEQYDSSFDTTKHILDVGRNIDVIIAELQRRKTISSDKIEEMDLVDLLILIMNGEKIPGRTDLLTHLNTNSKEYLAKNIDTVIDELYLREVNHDISKLQSPEKDEFDHCKYKLANMEYGTEEYNKSREALNLCLKHHYQQNRHHPEHFCLGIYDMNIIDIIEMLCDWLAACHRTKNGSIKQSLDVCEKRFGYNKSLTRILSNTVVNAFPNR